CFSPLLEITQMIEEMFTLGNAYLVVDEAHSTGIYGPEGQGRIALHGLGDKVLMRLMAFGRRWLRLVVRSSVMFIDKGADIVQLWYWQTA
ncbi:hypothetical protein BKA70DRAFT_1355721, partial [Coprinopsis sp. MPI-PUGE-AT-0042]